MNALPLFALCSALSITVPAAYAGGTSAADVAIVDDGRTLDQLADSTEPPRVDRTRKWAQGGVHLGLNGIGGMVGPTGSVSSDRVYVAAEAGAGFNIAGSTSPFGRGGVNLPLVIDNDTQVRVQGMAGYRRVNPGPLVMLATGPTGELAEPMGAMTYTATLEVTHWATENAGVSLRATVGAVRFSPTETAPEVGLTAGVSF